MIHSSDRILTTHAVSLPRSPELRVLVLAKANGQLSDPASSTTSFARRSPRWCSGKLRVASTSSMTGDLSKTNFTDYVRWRIAGYE